ncbi:PucR family transcriptional regulator [Desmospora profundinema]|uniref:PucR C-terminal helix-turn-helix domain-containing protein n=1 Tax=Desmospora profundinema TaxID=1571184 RepID=A0ABU1ILG3_9BACL|nr:helix-turn-helix domain-containing protein [Desmospora profundinema]MDR6225613.1 hypothetical protein [Desmospora profundinema]
MSDWEQIRSVLEEALDARVERVPASTDLGERLEITVLPFRMEGADWLLVVGETLSIRERSLLRVWLSERLSDPFQPTDFCERLAHWLRNPGDFTSPPAPSSGKWESRVPFLILEKRGRREGSDEVIARFFEGDSWLLSLQEGERLLMVSQSLLDGDEVSIESAWLDAAQGLAEAIATEAGEEVTVAVHAPVEAVEQLPSALSSLRDTVHIGRRFHPSKSAFAAWNLTLERLLRTVDDRELKRFLDDVSPIPFWREEELRRTLHVFLEQNLNVSETARRLFLHRNTLIYRLDRLKQETGLDVRQFEDALRVKLVLLLTGRERS